jgi:hypothetical protein
MFLKKACKRTEMSSKVGLNLLTVAEYKTAIDSLSITTTLSIIPIHSWII